MEEIVIVSLEPCSVNAGKQTHNPRVPNWLANRDKQYKNTIKVTQKCCLKPHFFKTSVIWILKNHSPQPDAWKVRGQKDNRCMWFVLRRQQRATPPPICCCAYSLLLHPSNNGRRMTENVSVSMAQPLRFHYYTHKSCPYLHLVLPPILRLLLFLHTSWNARVFRWPNSTHTHEQGRER